MPDNAIVLENAIVEGRMPQSYWDVPHTRQIEGFATDISTNAGEQVDFKINVNGGAGSDYKVEIFRLGYYGGDGARKVAEWVNTNATVQPDATYDASRGLVDAGNWSVTDSWDIPEDAVSGVYLVRLQRLDANGDPIEGAVNQIPFIVREDDRPADIVLQTSDTTWHAYNGWFGNNGQIGANFYGDASGTVNHPDIPGGGAFAQDRAYAVSYNRPFITRGIEGEQGGPAAGAQDYLFGADYAAIQWLEKNGYDVSYISGVDTDRLGSDYLLKYDAFLSVGHDEYWSGDQRYNVEDARDAGVNLLFWGGNDVYWKTRWESGIVDGVEYRTLVCYKETWAHADPNAGPEDYVNLDPTDTWTGTWRDIRFLGNPLAGDADDRPPLSGQPHLCNCAENALTGTIFGPDFGFGAALDVPAEFATLRVWRDTSIADGGATGLSPGIIGYEWNTSPDNEYRPAGLIKLSQTTVDWPRILIDEGNTVAPGTATHNLTLYRAESGALVFGAGTVFWTWALSDAHDSEPYGGSIVNLDLQQFVVNIFADMGIQPGIADAVLNSYGLVRATASTDTTPAVVTTSDLPDVVAKFQPVVITGTATDNDGNPLTDDGTVALIEISLDGGTTWRVAAGTSTWSYTWTPMAEGAYTVVVRAIDDSLNLPRIVDLGSQVVTVGPAVVPETLHLFSPLTSVTGSLFSDGTAITLGTRFTSAESGIVTGLRYFRHATDSGDTDVRLGHLWDAAGNLLGTVQFNSAPGASGWQSATLSAAITLREGTEYVVSYTTLDNYVGAVGFFTSPFTEPYGILSAPGGANGVYAYGSGLNFPTASYGNSNYWVDVSFTPVENDAPVFTSPSSVAVIENSSVVASLAATDTENNPVTYAIVGGADAAAFTLDPETGVLRFAFRPDHERPGDAGGNNVYNLIVSAGDGFNTPTEQAITVTVTDNAAEDGTTWSNLFGAQNLPTGVETRDTTDYELGTRFTAARAGLITELRYFRSAADAGDTDTRTLNLWDAAGNRITTVTVVSDPGQSGWQVGELDQPIAISAGQTYVVSYGTQQNYVHSAGFFGSAWTGPDGILSGGAGGGVFGGFGLFPTQTWNNTNYFVDVTLMSGGIANSAPVFSGPSALTVAENRTFVATVAVSDAQDDPLTFSIVGGADADRFALDSTTGRLSFLTTPDYEAPADAGGNNTYDIVIAVSDGQAAPVERAFTVSVLDDASELGGDDFVLFSSATPAATSLDDPTDYELGVKFQATTAGSIVALRYYRGAADSTDTDTRTLNLWDAAGNKLASVTVQSNPGESGWQVGVLDAPVALVAGQTYIASYGTTQNYAYTAGFFGSEWSEPGSVLLALDGPSNGGNGIFGLTPGDFPTLSYGNTNYWADVVFDDAVLA